MLTKFGKFCRKLRIERDDILKDMANMLGVTSAYLSAVENGKRDVPGVWKDKIIEHYKLNKEEAHELEFAIIQTRREVTLNLTEQSENRQEFALKLARRFDNLTSKEIKEMLKILGG